MKKKKIGKCLFNSFLTILANFISISLPKKKMNRKKRKEKKVFLIYFGIKYKSI